MTVDTTTGHPVRDRRKDRTLLNGGAAFEIRVFGDGLPATKELVAGRLGVGMGDAWCEEDDWPCDWPCFRGYEAVPLGMRPLEKYLKLWSSLPADTREPERMRD